VEFDRRSHENGRAHDRVPALPEAAPCSH
jgi:hypothetical protein